MKVYFINPPFLDKFSRTQRSPAVTKSNTMYYPLMLSQGASNLKYLSGIETTLIDAPAQGLSEQRVLSMVPSGKDNIAIIETSTPSIYNDIAFASRLKKQRSIRTYLVGTHISVLKEKIWDHPDTFIDGLLIEEWDKTLSDMLCNGIQNTPGILHKQDGMITGNDRPEVFGDLDRLPFVSRIYKEFLNIRDYFNPNARYPMVTISTSRGCPFKCRFCLYPQTFFSGKVRRRSIHNILEEIDFIYKELRPASIFFEDDCFTYDKDFIHNFCSEILKKYKRPFKWTANARADLDLQTLSLMKRAGLNVLCAGYESGNQKVLDWMNKGLTKRSMLEFSKNTKKAGIPVHGCFIIGAPFEDEASIEKTMDFIKELDCDTIQVYPIIAYPGTSIYEEYERLGLLDYDTYRDWLTPEGLLNTCINTRHLTKKQLIDLSGQIKRDFYLRPRYILKKAVKTILHPGEISRTLKAFQAFHKHLKIKKEEYHDQR